MCAEPPRDAVAFNLQIMTIKSYSSVVFLAAALAGVSLLTAQENKQDGAPKKQVAAKGRTSPHESTYARVGASRTLVSITYGRPYSAKGGKGEARKIWGGLVPYGKADRLGADEATMISLQHPIEIGGKTIPAGVHAMYIVPSEEGATKLAFSSNVAKWGIPVDESKDIARVDLTKEALDESVDQLTIAVENNPPGGVLKIKWEKTQFSVPFTVKA